MTTVGQREAIYFWPTLYNNICVTVYYNPATKHWWVIAVCLTCEREKAEESISLHHCNFEMQVFMPRENYPLYFFSFLLFYCHIFCQSCTGGFHAYFRSVCGQEPRTLSSPVRHMDKPTAALEMNFLRWSGRINWSIRLWSPTCDFSSKVYAGGFLLHVLYVCIYVS